MNKVRKLKIEVLLEALSKLNEVGLIFKDTESEDASDMLSELERIVILEVETLMGELDYDRCNECRAFNHFCRCRF